MDVNMARAEDASSRGTRPQSYRERDHSSREEGRRRSRSPERKRRRVSATRNHQGDSERRSSKPHGASREKRHRQKAEVPAELPFSARQLSKSDFPAFEHLFAHYLSLQKQIELDELSEREVKGRWKSFLGKWNRGELAEGWYDPDMFQRVKEMQPEPRVRAPEMKSLGREDGVGEGSDEDDDDYGPGVLPSASGSGRRVGPGIPSLDELAERNLMAREDAAEDRQASTTALRHERKADRSLQKERLEEMLPRAAPGSHERKVEKKQVVNNTMRDFKDKDSAMEAVDDNQLMGGGDELREYRAMREKEQRKKTDREIRREEIDRAKREEVEERRKAWKEREEGTMGMLRELARQRFG